MMEKIKEDEEIIPEPEPKIKRTIQESKELAGPIWNWIWDVSCKEAKELEKKLKHKDKYPEEIIWRE